MMQRFWTWSARSLVAAMVLGFAGCGEVEPPPRPRARRDAGEEPAPGASTTTTAAKPSAAPTGWGNIKGRVIWEGELPKLPDLTVTKDQEWCLAKGPVPDEALVVDPETKGVLNVVAYIKKAPVIHPDYPQDKGAVAKAALAKIEETNKIKLDELAAAVAEKKIAIADVKAPVLLDQIRCRYVPHALVVREGEPTVVLNYEEITHNVKITGISGLNDANPNMPPGSLNIFKWTSESNPLNIECSIHGWMKGFAMVLDHPYGAITAKDGSFELKNVPAGTVSFVLRNPRYIDAKTGAKGSARGNDLEVKAGETLDLGDIKVSASTFDR